MTVNTATASQSYLGNGATFNFAIPFYFLADTDLVVTRKLASTGAISTLVLNSDYTLTGSGVTSGGSLTMASAPATGDQISINRNVAIVQQTAYPVNDRFPAASHEKALDRGAMIDQQLNDKLSRALVRAPLASAYDIGGNLLSNVATAIADTDVPNLLQVRGQIVAGAIPAIGTASGASIVGYQANGTGAQLRNVNDRLNDQSSVFNYMTSAQIADVKAGTALVDVTTAIQNAVNANLYVYFPPGTYLISGTITLPTGSYLQGSGSTTSKVVRAGANLSGFVLAPNCNVNDFYFNRQGTTPATAGAWISGTGISTCHLRNIFIAYGYDGVVINGTSSAIFMMDMYVNNCVDKGVFINGGTNDVLLSNGVIGFCGTGLHLQDKAEAVILSNVDILGSTGNALVQTATVNVAGSRPNGNKYTNVYFDTCGADCVSITNSQFTTFSNCWFASSAASGANVGANALETSFSNCEFFNNAAHGAFVSSSLARFTKFIECSFVNNNALNNGSNGLTFAANVGDFHVVGCTSTNAFTGIGNNASGIGVAAGTGDRIYISGNNLTGNAVGAMSFAATGATVSIKDNAGYVTRNKGAAQMNSGSSSITFNHGLVTTPDSGATSVVPAGDVGSGIRWWVSAVTATQITITASAALASNVFFAWNTNVFNG